MQQYKFRFWDGKQMIYNGYQEADCSFNGLLVCEGDTVPLMWTGLKDKNGKEIYEGDIVKSVYHPTWRLGDAEGEARARAERREQVGIVEWDTCNPCFVINGIDFEYPEYDFICCDLRTNEIIGNIYESPELLPHP